LLQFASLILLLWHSFYDLLFNRLNNVRTFAVGKGGNQIKLIMTNNITAAVIGCNMNEEFFETSVRNMKERFYWKKILTTEKVTNLHMFPGAEIVSDEETIVGDSEISLVFVSPNHLHVVPKVIKAGKSVRVVE
jgi:hypothetical protein